MSENPEIRTNGTKRKFEETSSIPGPPLKSIKLTNTTDFVAGDDNERASSVRTPTTASPSHTKDVLSPTVDEQIDLLHLQKVLVEEERSQEFAAYAARYKARLRDGISLAEQYRNWMQTCADNLFDFEKQAAHDIWIFKKKELKAQMLRDVDEELKRIKSKNDRKNGPLNGDQKKLRNKNKSSSSKTMWSAKNNKIGLSEALEEKEIASDIHQIAKDWMNRCQQFHNLCSLKKCFAEHGVLTVENRTFSKGDCVVLTSVVTGSKFYATVVSITPSEIFVKCADGSRNRVYLTHLANGRVTIQEDNECFL